MRDTLNGWERKALGELSNTTSGGTPSRKRKDYYDGSIPWVKSGELNDDYIENTSEYISQLGLKNSSAKLFAPGTLLIALYGATVGKTSILRIFAATNQAVCGITPSAELDTEYLRYHLVFLRPKLLGHRYGGAQPNISQRIIRNLEVDYPSLPEQKSIASILSTVQQAIDAQKRIIETTRELKKALMQQLFTEGLRNEPQKQSEIGPIPKSWKVVPLIDVAEKPQYGLTASAQKSGHVKLLRITDITNEGINWKTVPYCSVPKKKIDNLRLKSDDIVIARIGATTGKSYIIKDPPAAVFASYLIRIQVRKKVRPGFLMQFFQSRTYWRQIDANKNSSLKKGVNSSILSKLLLPLPALTEQERISETLAAPDRKIEIASAKRQELQELFRTLLQDLMTAKARIKGVAVTMQDA